MEKNTIIIVSGIQRAGTSMLMQMLDKGGCPIAVDEYRTANEHNQNGYYENKALLQVNRNKRESYALNLIKNFEGKAIKIYTGLITLLPKSVFEYKVILIERNLKAVWASRHKSNPNTAKGSNKQFFAVQQKERMNQVIEKAKFWANSNTNVSLLKLKYEEVLAEPLQAAKAIENFLQLDLAIEKMASAVEPSLWIEKGADDYLKTDRSPLGVAKLVDEYAQGKTYCEIGIGEGHNLNLVSTPKRKFGIERMPYGVNRCKELYPHLEIIQGDFFKVYEQNQFEVCFMWIIYPYCKRFVSTIFEHNENATVLIGLNYWYHLTANDEKTKTYVNAYPKEANAHKWNDEIKEHLIELDSQGYQHIIKQVQDENGEIFSVAIVQKS